MLPLFVVHCYGHLVFPDLYLFICCLFGHLVLNSFVETVTWEHVSAFLFIHPDPGYGIDGWLVLAVWT